MIQWKRREEGAGVGVRCEIVHCKYGKEKKDKKRAKEDAEGQEGGGSARREKETRKRAKARVA
jgi:hypothetical protein